MVQNMQFAAPLLGGTLRRRYKRFLADVLLDTGETVTAHCCNPGAMLGLAEPGMRVWLSRSENAKRKLAFSWELVETDLGRGPALVGINTAHPNHLVHEAIRNATIGELAGYARLRREVRYGRNSRIDILLEDEAAGTCHVEVKNVHLMRKPGRAEFPDSVTVRGAKHLRELAEVASTGGRAVMLYLVQRSDAETFGLARDLDPVYAGAFAEATAAGVEALAYGCDLTPQGITVARSLPVQAPAAPLQPTAARVRRPRPATSP